MTKKNKKYRVTFYKGTHIICQIDDEEDNDGYYIVQWTSEPYTEQEGKEELMCNAVYLEKEQQIKDCYYKTEQTVEVRLQHVLKTGIELEQITDPKQVPKGVRKKRLLSREVYIRLIVMILKIFFNKSDAEKHLNTLKKNPV